MSASFFPSPPSAARAVGLLTVCAAALLSGCSQEDGGGPGGGPGGFQRPPTPVETAEVSQRALVERFEAVGTIQAAESITVVSEIPATVVRLPFREGDRVARGTVLAQLDDAELRASLARAEALRDQRQSAFNRVKLVVDQNAGTPQDLDDAAAELKIAQADVDLARARLAKARIIAPFSGRVGARQVSPGAFLQPGTPITNLARIDELKIVFSAPERYAPRLSRGAQVRVSTTAFPGESLAGTIDVVNPVLDAETRSVEIIARASNPQERFRPGMSADVSAVVSQRDEALTIPPEAVFAEGENTLVYLVNQDSTVSRQVIQLGLRLADAVEVRSGLNAGQSVVRAGHQKLFEGARVMPVTSSPPGASAGSGS